ncbi:MAG: tRNA pseudouridine(55) synthase TruB [Pseudomonadota bacterium]|jgi:tRNA pseudouridine55 synthase
MQENKFFNVYKPINQTSNYTLMQFRKKTGFKKSGFAGTLDPFADGVLPIAVNKATKQIDVLLKQPKEYIFTMKFGILTDTSDITGNVIQECQFECNSSELEKTLQQFKGEIQQSVPIYSAAKVNGKRMCDLARSGVDLAFLEQKSIEKTKTIIIHKVELLKQLSKQEFQIRVVCGSGTYIRQLAVDVAKQMNTIATVSQLTRTAVGDFKIQDSIAVENLHL